jgi:hypothetical protein
LPVPENAKNKETAGESVTHADHPADFISKFQNRRYFSRTLQNKRPVISKNAATPDSPRVLLLPIHTKDSSTRWQHHHIHLKSNNP